MEKEKWLKQLTSKSDQKGTFIFLLGLIDVQTKKREKKKMSKGKWAMIKQLTSKRDPKRTFTNLLGIIELQI